MMRWRDERGDTLIEVLIAIAVISMVLAAAYVITSRNTAALQANQERVQAEHLVQSQVEALRAYLASGQSTSGSTNFCMSKDSSNNPIVATDSVPCSLSGDTDNGADYSGIIVPPGGSLPAGTPCGTVPDSTANSYTACVYWTGLGSATDNTSDVTLYYKWSSGA